MTKLYEIANEYSEIFRRLSDDGVDSSIIEDTLSPLSKDFNEKAKNVVAWMNNIDSEVEELENHKRNIEERIRKRKSEIAFYKDYIKTNMLKMGMKSIKCSFFDITVKNSTPKLQKYDEMAIPSEYIKTEIITKIDDSKIKQNLKNGQLIPGAKLEETFSLTIKMK